MRCSHCRAALRLPGPGRRGPSTTFFDPISPLTPLQISVQFSVLLTLERLSLSQPGTIVFAAKRKSRKSCRRSRRFINRRAKSAYRLQPIAWMATSRSPTKMRPLRRRAATPFNPPPPRPPLTMDQELTSADHASHPDISGLLAGVADRLSILLFLPGYRSVFSPAEPPPLQERRCFVDPRSGVRPGSRYSPRIGRSRKTDDEAKKLVTNFDQLTTHRAASTPSPSITHLPTARAPQPATPRACLSDTIEERRAGSRPFFRALRESLADVKPFVSSERGLDLPRLSVAVRAPSPDS